MSENKKPKLAEVLGVEVGEEFEIKTFGEIYHVDKWGILRGEDNIIENFAAIYAINHPESINRFPLSMARKTENVAELSKYKDAIERMGEFGRLFVEYSGCDRGAVGRYGGPLEKEIMIMGVIKDVDGGEWVPVNKDALVELVGRYNLLAGMVGGDPFAKGYEKEDEE